VDKIEANGSIVTVTGYIFDHADLRPQDIQVYAGEDCLVRKTAGALNPGEFIADSASALRFRAPSTIHSGDQAPLRIIILSAESPPRWFEAP
jgi:hypothetical protein